MRFAYRAFAASLALCVGALSSASVYFVASRSSLPIQTEPFGFPSQEGRLTGAWGFGRQLEDRRIVVRADGVTDPFGLRQTDAHGEGGTWWGNFSPGQRVLYSDGPWAGATYVFLAQTTGTSERTAVSGFGARVQTKEHGAFVAEIRAFDRDANAWSPWFHVAGDSTRAASGGAVFVGIGSTGRNLTAVQVRTISEQNVAFGWMAMNAPSLSLAPGPADGVHSAP